MVIFGSPTYSWLRVQHVDCLWCSVREVSLHWSLNKSESSLMQSIHHENMNSIFHPSVDGRGAFLHEWAGWFHACKWRLDTQTHPSPHSCAEKCEWGSGSWRWNGIPPHPFFLHGSLYSPPPVPIRLEPGAHMMQRLDRPRNIHMVSIHTHTLHVLTLLPLTYMYIAAFASVTCIACLHAYTIMPQTYASVSRKICPLSHCFCVAYGLIETVWLIVDV